MANLNAKKYTITLNFSARFITTIYLYNIKTSVVYSAALVSNLGITRIKLVVYKRPRSKAS